MLQLLLVQQHQLMLRTVVELTLAQQLQLQAQDLLLLS